jgi:hypothetical protein
MMEIWEDLDFADDICLLAQRWSDRKARLDKFDKKAANVRLKINGFKAKEVRVNHSTDLALTVNSTDIEH